MPNYKPFGLYVRINDVKDAVLGTPNISPFVVATVMQTVETHWKGRQAIDVAELGSVMFELSMQYELFSDTPKSGADDFEKMLERIKALPSFKDRYYIH